MVEAVASAVRNAAIETGVARGGPETAGEGFAAGRDESAVLADLRETPGAGPATVLPSATPTRANGKVATGVV